MFDEHAFRVIVDYGHNPAAMERMTELVKSLRKKRAIGVLQAAGDRRDVDIRAIGRIAGGTFDFLVTKEDDARRGRPEGEVARLLAEGAKEGGIAAESVIVLPNEPDAVEHALSLARPDDSVVIFADDIARTWKRSFTSARNGHNQASATARPASESPGDPAVARRRRTVRASMTPHVSGDASS